MGLRDEILKRQELSPVPFETTTAGEVWVRRFTGVQRGVWDKFNADSITPKGDIADPSRHQAKLVQLSLVDSENALLFADGELPAVQAMNGAFLEEVFLESARVNLLTMMEVARARANFRATQANASSSGSPGSAASPTPNGSGETSPANN